MRPSKTCRHLAHSCMWYLISHPGGTKCAQKLGMVHRCSWCEKVLCGGKRCLRSQVLQCLPRAGLQRWNRNCMPLAGCVHVHRLHGVVIILLQIVRAYIIAHTLSSRLHKLCLCLIMSFLLWPSMACTAGPVCQLP